MMKRKSCLFVLFPFFVFALSACAVGGAKFMGTTLDPRDISIIKADKGEHTYNTKFFSIQYNYIVDADNKRLILDGVITCLLDPTTHPLGAVLNRLTYNEIYIWVLFTNETGRVIDVQKIRLSPSTQIFIPVNFTRALSFLPACHGISMRMSVFMRDGLNMIDTHALDYS